jgi:TonB-linked SusC/RagA family outer membrane protein
MRWSRVRLLLCPLVLALGVRDARAQAGTGRVTGILTDSITRLPVTGATVAVDGTRLAGVSGNDGRYAIVGVTAGPVQLRATRLGFAPKELRVTIVDGQTTTADFLLQGVASTLSQVVVVGYGTQRRSDLTGSVSSVTPNTDRNPITSLEQTLQGTAPGVQVTQASSAPGGGISIRIRGSSSVNGNNEPLYVIDGFPVENNPQMDTVTSGGRQNTAPSNPLAAINPSDIVSIEILKDASATAIYGSRAANGVVMITTKSGVAGRSRVSLDLYTGVQNAAKRYDLLDAQQFAEFANEYATSQNLAVPYANPASLGKGTDWQDLIFRQAPMSNLQMSVSGGTTSANTTRYAVSGGVFQQDGVVRGSDFRRLSLRGNLDQTVGTKGRVASNVLVSRVNSAQVPVDGAFNAGAGAVGAALQYIPVLKAKKADGSYTLLQEDYPAELRALGSAPANVPNPLSLANDVQDKLADTRILANVFGEYQVVSGLTFKSSIGSDLSNRTRDTYYPRTTLQGLNRNGQAIRGRNENTSFLNENTLTYAKTFGTTHDISAVAGYSRQMQNLVRTSLNNSNFVSDITGFENVGAGSQSGGPGVGSGRTRWTLASYIGRVNYTLLDRYLFTLTGRRDGSSRFGADHRWGTFPSVAAGWKVSEEPFMKRFTQIDQLKLRASWGVTGNPSIQPYQSVTRLAAQQYSFNGTLAPGYFPSALGNDDLSWESTKQTDVGVDLALWQGLVEMSGDIYKKRTDDLLLGIDLPSESGYNTALVNAGSIENKGIELSLSIRPFNGDTKAGAFRWSTTLNYARNRNKVVDLGGVQRIFATTSIAPDLTSVGQGTLVQVGQPIGVFFGYRTDGIFNDSSEVADYLRTTRLASGNITPGQVRLVDVNADGVIDANDRTIIGDPNPTWTGGWQNSVSWKGFELSSLFDAAIGSDVLNLNLYRLYGASPGTNISVDRWLDRWTPTHHDARYPRTNSTPVAIGADFTNAVLEDGSFIRFRTITLSREVPARWLRGRGLSGARLYVTGQNLYTWTDYSGFNPDVSSLGVGNLNRGIDIGAYPIARTFIFGMNLNY